MKAGMPVRKDRTSFTRTFTLYIRRYVISGFVKIPGTIKGSSSPDLRYRERGNTTETQRRRCRVAEFRG